MLKPTFFFSLSVLLGCFASLAFSQEVANSGDERFDFAWEIHVGAWNGSCQPGSQDFGYPPSCSIETTSSNGWTDLHFSMKLIEGERPKPEISLLAHNIASIGKGLLSRGGTLVFVSENGSRSEFTGNYYQNQIVAILRDVAAIDQALVVFSDGSEQLTVLIPVEYSLDYFTANFDISMFREAQSALIEKVKSW